MNWRQWVYVKLVNNATLTNLVDAANIVAAGSVIGAPKERPFISTAL